LIDLLLEISNVSVTVTGVSWNGSRIPISKSRVAISIGSSWISTIEVLGTGNSDDGCEDEDGELEIYQNTNIKYFQASKKSFLKI